MKLYTCVYETGLFYVSGSPSDNLRIKAVMGRRVASHCRKTCSYPSIDIINQNQNLIKMNNPGRILVKQYPLPSIAFSLSSLFSIPLHGLCYRHETVR